jgi:uncharacterized tellurite resistance protein B-like protein
MNIDDDTDDQAERLKRLPKHDLFRQEADRLAKLPARQRKAELAVHWQIANNSNLSKVTRDYARRVAEVLEALVKELLKARK